MWDYLLASFAHVGLLIYRMILNVRDIISAIALEIYNKHKTHKMYRFHCSDKVNRGFFKSF